MGGRVGDALAIVDWLVDHDVHATIFMTGAHSGGRDALTASDARRRCTLLHVPPAALRKSAGK